jgi:UDP-2,3-diacylglucosamine pyrophosphatase LpxH
MPLFCISDLHLGDRGPRDNFCVGGREQRFLQFLDYVKQNNGQLLILGDLFDWWQLNIETSLEAYREMLERMSAARWVVGNHDAACGIEATVEIKMPHPWRSRDFVTDIGGRRFAFCHGHEADPFCNSENPGIGQITAILSAVAEDRNKGPYHNGRPVEDEIVGPMEKAASIWNRLHGRESRETEMANAILAYRLEHNADAVVCGHTHAAGRIGDVYFNCGCWCRERDTFVQIDDAGSISVWEWTADGAIPFDHELRAA